MRNFRVRRDVQNMTGLCKKPSSAPRIGLNCTLVQVKKGLGPPALGPFFNYAHDLRAESVIQPCQTCSTHHPLHQASGFVRVCGSVNARVQEIYILVANGVTHALCTTCARFRQNYAQPTQFGPFNNTIHGTSILGGKDGARKWQKLRRRSKIFTFSSETIFNGFQFSGEIKQVGTMAHVHPKMHLPNLFCLIFGTAWVIQRPKITIFSPIPSTTDSSRPQGPHFGVRIFSVKKFEKSEISRNFEHFLRLACPF